MCAHVQLVEFHKVRFIYNIYTLTFNISQYNMHIKVQLFTDYTHTRTRTHTHSTYNGSNMFMHVIARRSIFRFTQVYCTLLFT